MSYGDLGLVKTYITTTDLSAEAKQYTFVKTTGATSEGLQVVATAGAGGADVVGVQWNRPAAGFAVAVVGDAGATPHMLSGAAIAMGAAVSSNANGQPVTATTGQTVLGIAKNAVAAAGQYVTIELLAAGKYVKA